MLLLLLASSHNCRLEKSWFINILVASDKSITEIYLNNENNLVYVTENFKGSFPLGVVILFFS